jgi:hypothetical protein
MTKQTGWTKTTINARTRGDELKIIATSELKMDTAGCWYATVVEDSGRSGGFSMNDVMRFIQ